MEWFNRRNVHITVLIGIVSFVIINFLVYYLFGFSEVYLELLAPSWNREFGLIENLQNVVLILCLGFSIKLCLKEKQYKFVYIAISILLGILFLEEVDYFMHFYDFIFYGQETYVTSIKGYRNFHNNDGITFWSRLSYIVLSIMTLFIFLKLGIKYRRKLYFFIMLFLVFAFFNMFPGDDRQINSETKELCLYSAWYFLLFRKVYINKDKDRV